MYVISLSYIICALCVYISARCFLYLVLYCFVVSGSSYFKQSAELRVREGLELFGRSRNAIQASIGYQYLPPVERIIHSQFYWQESTAYLNDAMSETPLCIMANMQHSPAAKASDLLCHALLNHVCLADVENTNQVNHFLRGYWQIHTGRVDCKSVVVSLLVSLAIICM